MENSYEDNKKAELKVKFSILKQNIQEFKKDFEKM